MQSMWLVASTLGSFKSRTRSKGESNNNSSVPKLVSSPALQVRHAAGRCKLNSLPSIRALPPPYFCVFHKAQLPQRTGCLAVSEPIVGGTPAAVCVVSSRASVTQRSSAMAERAHMVMGMQDLLCSIRLSWSLGSCICFGSRSLLQNFCQIHSGEMGLGWAGKGVKLKVILQDEGFSFVCNLFY